MTRPDQTRPDQTRPDQTRPDQTRHFSNRAWLTFIFQTLSLTVIMSGILIGYWMIVFGSYAKGKAWLAGESLMAHQPELRLTFKPTDKSVKFQFQVSNLTGSPIRILGSSHSCSCTVVGVLPDRILPHGTVTIDVQVKIDPKQSSGGIDGSVQLLTNHLQHSELELKYFLRPAGPGP